MDNAPDGRRERKKHQTALALHEAALRLFAEHGFQETTVEEIADAADVSARTFFRYYVSKEAVVFADEGERREVWAKTLHDRPWSEPVLDSLREASIGLAGMAIPAKDFFRWGLAVKAPSVAAAALQVSSRWEGAVAAEVAERLGLASKNDLVARTIAAASIGAWRSANGAWFANGGRSQLADHLRSSYAVLTHLGGFIPGDRALASAT